MMEDAKLVPQTIVRLVALVVSCIVFSTVANAATVRGRLDRVKPNGIRYAGAGVAVTVYSQAMGRSNPAYAGPDGMYYLFNVPAGAYYLEVWVSRDPRVPPRVYPISVAEPYSDIPPIVVP